MLARCGAAPQGSGEPAARDMGRLVFGASVLAGSRGKIVEISFAWTVGRSLYGVRGLLQTFRCTLVSLVLRRGVVDFWRKYCS